MHYVVILIDDLLINSMHVVDRPIDFEGMYPPPGMPCLSASRVDARTCSSVPVSSRLQLTLPCQADLPFIAALDFGDVHIIVNAATPRPKAGQRR